MGALWSLQAAILRVEAARFAATAVDQAAADTATAAATAAAAEATAAARERKSDLQRERRHGEEAVLQALLSTLIVRLEYSAAREQRAKDRVQRASKLPWRCLGGCTAPQRYTRTVCPPLTVVMRSIDQYVE